MIDLEHFNIHENPNVFFSWLKKMSEMIWENTETQQGVFSFQTQKATKWLEGLTEDEIEEFEDELGFAFPEIYKFYLRKMNGTDTPSINIYGSRENTAYAPNYYSFPRDLAAIKDNIEWVYKEFLVDEEDVRHEKIPHIIPIVGHRFLIADNCAKNPVLSIYGRDSIIYAPDLPSFLVADIFDNHTSVPFDLNYEIKLWLNEDLGYLNDQ